MNHSSGETEFDDTDLPSLRAPIGLEAALEMAWGLTLNLSSDKNQNAVGAKVLAGVSDLKSDFKNYPSAVAYLDELSIAFASYLRTNGFDLEVLVGYLDRFKESRDVKVKSINDLSNLASLSPGSFLVRAAGFLGIGSLTDVSGDLGGLTKPTPGLPFNLTGFLFLGFVGMVALTLVFRGLQPWLVGRAIRKCQEQQLKFWKTFGRPMYIEELVNLGAEVQKIQARFSYMADDTKNTKAIAEALLPSEKLYELRY